MVLVGSEYSGENSLLHWVSVYPSDKPGKVKINDNGQQLFLEIEHLAKLTLKGSIILHEKYNFGEPGFIGI
jgi:hypothetical protein